MKYIFDNDKSKTHFDRLIHIVIDNRLLLIIQNMVDIQYIAHIHYASFKYIFTGTVYMYMPLLYLYLKD